ncbi:MAG: hypothetical protein KC800_09265 [Candidatus Eremiobacteraeota bacterium]|nr:hypothetical protein [Candidatus Eremiobacteraeota bacterium]
MVSSFVFSSRLDTKRESQHQAALLALDSMEEARALITQDFKAFLDQPKRRHVEIRDLYLERTTDFVGDELGLEDEKLREVTVLVTWGSDDRPERYVLKERFLRP